MRTATFYNFLIEANIMASIAIILMLVVRRFFRKQLGNRAIYFAWLLVAIRLLCPLALPNPVISEIRPEIQGDQGMRPIADQVRVRLNDVADDLYYRSYRAEQSETVTDAAQTVRDALYRGTAGRTALKIYLIGVGVTAAWFVFSNVRFRRKLKAARIEPISGKLLEEYNALCAARGVKPIPVYLTDPLPSACLVGVIKPYIALPVIAKPQDAVSVLQHEVCHYRGKDHWLGIVRLLCCALHWFNPLVWLASDMSRTDGELSCDDRVVDKLDKDDKIAYANVLVLAAAKRSAPGLAVLATGMTMTGKKLKTRVSAILHRDHFRRGFALAFMIVSSMLLVCAFATDEMRLSVHIPVIAAVQPTALTPAADEAAAVAAAEEFLALQTIDLKKDAPKVTVVSHENGIWYLSALSDAYEASSELHITDEGKAVYFDHSTSNWESAEPIRIDELTNGDPSTRNRAEHFATVFLCSVLPKEDVGKLGSFRLTGASKILGNSFLVGQARMENEDGAATYISVTMQVAPVVRVVGYQNDEETKLIEASLGIVIDQNPGVSAAQYPESVYGFHALNRTGEYASYTQPSDNDLALEKAVEIAVNAIIKEYSEEETFGDADAFREMYYLEYGFVNHEYAFYTAPYWELHFIYPRSGEPLFSVYVHSPDGEILDMSNGNG